MDKLYMTNWSDWKERGEKAMLGICVMENLLLCMGKTRVC